MWQPHPILRFYSYYSYCVVLTVILENGRNATFDTFDKLAPWKLFSLLLLLYFSDISQYIPSIKRPRYNIFIGLLQASRNILIPKLEIHEVFFLLHLRTFYIKSHSLDVFSCILQYDGITNIYHTPFLIDLINSGSMTHPDLRIAVPERFVNPGERHHLYVPGSGKAFVSIVGWFLVPSV